MAILALMRTRWDFHGKLGLCLVLGAINSGVPFVLYSVAAQLLPWLFGHFQRRPRR